MGRVTGKVAIVTGAARGQGAAEARILCAEGAQVMLTDILDEEGQALAAELGENASYMHHDVCNENEWNDVVAATEDKFGPVNILINNAGILKLSELTKTELSDYMQVINVNQVGVFLGMKVAAESMKKAGSGSIVNISSIDGLVGMSYGVAYVASKFAVRGMTKVAALELGKFGIRVNSIHPGGVNTPMVTDSGLASSGGDGDNEGNIFSNVPLGRIGEPEDVAKLALFLASDEASYSSGSEFIIDGAMTAGFTLG
ncbi:MAG: glucose 1-dehydrogenase [Pseudomonadales bacterium]|nr:glucose 1-dehydrogenase [Pseudomonadales bacterium]